MLYVILRQIWKLSLTLDIKVAILAKQKVTIIMNSLKLEYLIRETLAEFYRQRIKKLTQVRLRYE